VEATGISGNLADAGRDRGRLLFPRQHADRRAGRAGCADVATALKLPPKVYLMPLSYITVLIRCCSMIGTSTNLLFDDMAHTAGQPRFGIF